MRNCVDRAINCWPFDWCPSLEANIILGFGFGLILAGIIIVAVRLL